MDRRTFLKGAIAAPAAAQLTGFASTARGQQKEFTPRPGTWRTFEITTRIEVLEPTGTVRAWLPMPSVKSEYQKLLGDQWSGNAKVMKPLADGIYGAGMLYAEFAPDERAPVVATEVCGTSITSQGPSAAGTAAAVAHNPHIRFANSDRRGYARDPGGGLSCEPVPSDPIGLSDIVRSRLCARMQTGNVYEFHSAIFQPAGK